MRIKTVLKPTSPSLHTAVQIRMRLLCKKLAISVSMIYAASKYFKKRKECYYSRDREVILKYASYIIKSTCPYIQPKIKNACTTYPSTSLRLSVLQQTRVRVNNSIGTIAISYKTGNITSYGQFS
jgi:hypothetical protein